MASLLGDYSKYNNPLEGLNQGLETGMKFGLLSRQQRMAEEQMKQQQASKEKAEDMKMVSVLFDAAGKQQSKSMRAQMMQKAYDLLGKYDGTFQGVQVDPGDESFNQFVSKARKFSKPLVENPDAALKDLKAFLQEMAEEYEQGDLDEKQYKQVVDTVSGVKKEAAGELGGLITDVNRFKPEYQDPEGKRGIEDYQTQLTGQVTALDPNLGSKMSGLVQKEKQAAEYKPPQPWGFIAAPDGSQKAVGFDPNSKKVVTYDMPFSGQVTPFSLGRTPAAEIKTGTALDTLKDNVNRIRSSYKPEYVGFVKGRVKQLQAGTVGGVPEEQAAFYADVNDISDMLLRARSGAQINEQEYQRLLKLVPNPNLPAGTFKARLNRFEKQLDQTLRNQQRRLQQGGYIAPAIKGQAGTTGKDDPLGLRQ